MPSLRKTVSRVPSRSGTNEAQAQQFGRSPSILAAEVASAALRENGSVRSPMPTRPTTPSAVSITSPNKENIDTDGTMTPSEHVPPLPPPYRRSVSTSMIPSKPNLISPNASLSSQEGDTISSAGVMDKAIGASDISRNQNPKKFVIPASQLSRQTPNRGQQSPPELENLQRSCLQPISRSHTTMTLSDLGKDYSRYPFRSNPPSFSPSATASTTLLSGALVQSDPFTDLSASSEKGGQVVEEHFSPFLDDRIGAPSTADYGYKFPMYLDEKEYDDDMHTPFPDDDIRLKAKFRDYFARGQICTLLGMLCMLLGITLLFIILPILSETGVISISFWPETPLSEMGSSSPVDRHSWAYVNDQKYPLLQNIRTGLIDPSTPQSAMTRTAIDGSELQLVFSDEFNAQNRTFYPGDDPFWTAPDIWYGATLDLEWYDPDAATTFDGTLIFQLDKFLNHGLEYRSGMLNSWNQICFKGGALEVSVSLAGPGGVPGLWPGAWTMGNLGRPGYMATTEGVWPYTYDSCDIGITPNQSTSDGLSWLPGQKLPSCVCPGADHPSPGTGRGAPEIDVFEAGADPNLRIGIITQSYQVAPYDVWYYPDYNFFAIPNGNTTKLNTWCGGGYQQAVSGTTTLNKDWYDGNEYQKYAFEYTPGTGGDAQIGWFVGDEMSYMMNGNSIGPNGNVQSRVVSEEPMSMILNLGISPKWTFIDFDNLKFPTMMRVDYVRWYQPAGQTSVTCDPVGYETTEYIKNHSIAYNNPNLTTWDETGYGWPEHQLNSNC